MAMKGAGKASCGLGVAHILSLNRGARGVYA